MVRHTCVSDHFGTLYIKGLKQHLKYLTGVWIHVNSLKAVTVFDKWKSCNVLHSFFFIRISKFCLRLAVLFFFLFGAEMFLICSYFPD